MAQGIRIARNSSARSRGGGGASRRAKASTKLDGGLAVAGWSTTQRGRKLRCRWRLKKGKAGAWGLFISVGEEKEGAERRCLWRKDTDSWAAGAHGAEAIRLTCGTAGSVCGLERTLYFLCFSISNQLKSNLNSNSYAFKQIKLCTSMNATSLT